MDTRDKAVLLVTRMQTEIVHFSYEKRDGTVRDAWGTLNSQFYDYQFKTDRPRYFVGYVTYWDFYRKTWRMFKTERLRDILS